MKKWSAVRTLIIVGGLGTAAVLGACASRSFGAGPAGPTEEEYAVYGTVVSEVLTGPYQRIQGARRDSIPAGLWVLTPREAGLAAVFDSSLHNLAGVDPTAVESYLHVNQGEFELEPRVPGLRQQVTISRQELAELFDGGGWDGFNRRYPGDVGLVGLSRVGFSQDGESALVFVSRYHGGLNGEFGIVHLQRGSTGWSIVGWPLGKAISE